METSELSGLALDWAVGVVCGVSYALHGRVPFSTDWAHGGPLIDVERISIIEEDTGGASAWFAVKSRGPQSAVGAYGPTPLVAAMRCFVRVRMGEEIELPAGLVD